MTENALQGYLTRLKEMASRLSGEVSALRGEALRPTGTEMGGATASAADPAVEAAAEAIALTLLGTEGHTLAEVNAALDRIERGTFGRCVRCGRAVSKARLDVLPHTRHCVGCAGITGPK